ncbi:hypothetical protein U1Q18_035480 [Sarracenia purpurea var. burkii]
MMVLYKQKKNQGSGKSDDNRLLISITVIGSVDPTSFVVNEGMLVIAVIVTTLKSYAHEGRLPILGSSLIEISVVGTRSPETREEISSADRI